MVLLEISEQATSEYYGMQSFFGMAGVSLALVLASNKRIFKSR